MPAVLVGEQAQPLGSFRDGNGDFASWLASLAGRPRRRIATGTVATPWNRRPRLEVDDVSAAVDLDVTPVQKFLAQHRPRSLDPRLGATQRKPGAAGELGLGHSLQLDEHDGLSIDLREALHEHSQERGQPLLGDGRRS